MASLILGAFTAEDRSPTAVSPLLEAEGDERPGVLLELSGRRAGEDASDSRWARLPGLVVRRGEPVSPFLDAGTFRAVWRGRLRIDTRDRYEFIAVGSGEVELLVDGDLEFKGRITPEKSLSSKPRRLSKGLHDVEIRLSPRLGGRASFRLEWQSRRFGREPVPASNWVLPSAESGVDWAAFAQSNRQRRAGSLLVAGRCGHCHEPPQSQLEVLKPGAAKLRSAGLTEDWLAAWILDPKSLDDETFMPRMLAGPEASAEARDLAAFLARQGEVTPSLAGDASVGSRLWADLGCFSCHDFSDPRDAGNWKDHNIPLGLVSAKYQLGGIAQFVQDPRAWRPGTAMPDFRLTENEASDLEAFLRGAASLVLEEVDSGDGVGDADRGRGLFDSRNCRSCHALDASSPSGTVAAGTLREVLGAVTSDSSCANGSHGPGRPANSFSAKDLQAFGEFAEAGGLDAFERRVPEEEANRLLLQRRCIACHSIDGKTSQWSARIDRLDDLGITEHPERSGEAEKKKKEKKGRVTKENRSE